MKTQNLWIIAFFNLFLIACYEKEAPKRIQNNIEIEDSDEQAKLERQKIFEEVEKDYYPKDIPKTATKSKIKAESKIKKEIIHSLRKQPKLKPKRRISRKMGVLPTIGSADMSTSYGSFGGRGIIHGGGKVMAPKFNTESYGYLPENSYYSVLDNPLSTFSIDVDTASYSNVRRMLMAGRKVPVDAVRIEEFINYFSYDYQNPSQEDPFSINLELADCPWKKGNKLALIGLSTQKIDLSEAKPQNLTFLIDVSGSMQGADRLGLLKKAFILLSDNLREQDRISIVVYAGSSGLVLPPVSGSEKNKIQSAINNLRAGGSTAGGQGILLAYQQNNKSFIEGGVNRVILATDGDFNVGVSDTGSLVRMIKKMAKSNIFLSVLGFGRGNLNDNMMEKLSNHGNGNYSYIDSLREAKKVLIQQMGASLITVAKDVKIQVEFNPAQVKSYRLIGYVNRKLKNQDFKNDKVDAGEVGAGHQVTALYEIELQDGKEKNAIKLKYQKERSLTKPLNSLEVLTVKVRYKPLKSQKSILLSKVLNFSKVSFLASSDNLKFSASVASFAMKLRKSKFQKEISFQQIIRWAEMSKGRDMNSYRMEFIGLAQRAGQIYQLTD